MALTKLNFSGSGLSSFPTGSVIQTIFSKVAVQQTITSSS